MTDAEITAALETIGDGLVCDFTPWELGFIVAVLRERAAGAVEEWRGEILQHIAAARANIAIARKAGAPVWSHSRIGAPGDAPEMVALSRLVRMRVSDITPPDLAECGNALNQWVDKTTERFSPERLRSIIKICDGQATAEEERRRTGRTRWGTQAQRGVGR